MKVDVDGCYDGRAAPGARDNRAELVCREANAAIEASRQRLGVGGVVPYLCECDAKGCHEFVGLTGDEYGRARASADRFVVAPGHAVGDSTIVEEEEKFVIVEALSSPGDPRSR